MCDMDNSTKKRNLKIIIAVTIFVVAFSIGFIRGFRAGEPKAITESRTRVMFDTVVRITIEGHPDLDYPRIFKEIWDELSVWEEELNLYDSSSALNIANQADSSTVLPARLGRAVGQGLASIVPTGGTFDIRIGEMTALWDFAGEGRVPSRREITAAFERMHRPIRMRGDTLEKEFDEPRLDLGGIAKGLACDAVFEILDTIEGIDRFIVDLGGNIRAKSSTGKSFNIGVQSPISADSVVGKFILESGRACATAGDYQRYFVIDDVKYHHILDPKTGMPSRKCSGVTVVAPDGATADIVSTALFVMGPEDGMAYLDLNSEIKAVFLDSTGTIIAGDLEVSPLLDGEK